MRDQGLLFRQNQSPFSEEIRQHVLDSTRRVLVRTRHDEVVRIADEVDSLGSGVVFLDKTLHSIQSNVRESRRDDPALRSPALRIEQFLLVIVACFEELPQDVLVHAHVVEKPFMGDVVETAFYVPFEDPLG